ncbi:MAG: leucine-rich repeat domain-containing protein [Clostridiales bacterium]|nr:leucine-rich repeat domain-containing protein [Clostridiales bacterium]
MENTNNEKRKLFVYTIIISLITAVSVFLPLFYGIGSTTWWQDVVPGKVDIGIFNMLMDINHTAFLEKDYMICMVIVGWPVLVFGLVSVLICLSAFVKNDDNQVAVYKKLNFGGLILSLSYAVVALVDMIIAIVHHQFIVPLNWVYSVVVGFLYIGFKRHCADYTEGEGAAHSKKSKISMLIAIVSAAAMSVMSVGLVVGLKYDRDLEIVKDGVVYQQGYSGYGGSGEVGYIAVTTQNITDETLVIPNNINGLRVVEIGERAFADAPCKEILLPGSIYKIGQNAFEDCPNLEKVVAPVSVIENSAFSGCMSLETFATSAVEIGESAFSGCAKLKEVFCNNVKTIGWSAFKNCVSLESFTFAPSLTTIGEHAFENAGFTSLTFTKVRTIGDYAFTNCDKLTTVDLGKSVRVVGSQAFYDCDSLTAVILGDVTELQYSAFSACPKLTSVTYYNYSSRQSDAIFVLPASLTTVYDIWGTVFYMGTKAQWDELEKANIFTEKIYYYSKDNPYEDNPDDRNLYWHMVEGVPTVWPKP